MVLISSSLVSVFFVTVLFVAVAVALGEIVFFTIVNDFFSIGFTVCVGCVYIGIDN